MSDWIMDLFPEHTTYIGHMPKAKPQSKESEREMFWRIQGCLLGSQINPRYADKGE